jgi:hypothetical protein
MLGHQGFICRLSTLIPVWSSEAATSSAAPVSFSFATRPGWLRSRRTAPGAAPRENRRSAAPIVTSPIGRIASISSLLVPGNAHTSRSGGEQGLSDREGRLWVHDRPITACPRHVRSAAYTGRKTLEYPVSAGIRSWWGTALKGRDYTETDILRQYDLRLQLTFQLVEETPVGALGDERVRARLDHADLVQPERIEPERVLGIVLAPAGIGDFT